MLKFNDGFTLLEVLITMSVLAILLTVAVPSFDRFIQNRQLGQQTTLIATAFSTARSIALSKAAGTSVCWNDTNATAVLPTDSNIDVAVGEMLVIDPSEATSDTRIKNQISFLSEGYNLVDDFAAAASGQTQCVVFDSQGRSVTAGNFVICRAGGDEADSITITLNVNGRTSEVKGNQLVGTNCV